MVDAPVVDGLLGPPGVEHGVDSQAELLLGLLRERAARPLLDQRLEPGHQIAERGRGHVGVGAGAGGRLDLIEERVEGGEQKVPGLGDVPVLGQLFRYDNRRRVKTNLLVFLRPVIVRDSDGAHSITADRYEFMRAARLDASLPPHWALPDFKAAGAVVVGVSPDSTGSHDKFKAKHKLGVTLAADIDRKVIDRYGVWGEKMMYGRKLMGLIRSTFLIGPDGKILMVWRNVRVKGHVPAVLEAAKTA